MAESENEERTEEATQTRREEFRNRGQVAQTRELSSVFMLVGTALLLYFLGRFFLIQVTELFDHSLGQFLVAAARKGEYVAAVQFALQKSALFLLPLFGLYLLMGFASTLVQVGFLYNEEALEPKLERLDPIEGFKKIFSIRSVVEGIKAILKLCCIGIVVYYIFRSEFAVIPQLVSYSLEQLLAYLGSMVFKLFMTVGIAMAVVSALDYFFNWWDLEKQMRMTKQEIKEEVKSREGDPLIRSRIRRLQREMASRRMMDEVKKADVIVTNPTHLAVALKYDSNKAPAPRVVAKGAGFIADKIRELAKQYNIPIVENKPLARTMFKTLKVGQVIPRELYTAVAEVLAYVFRLKRRKVNR